MKKLMLIFVASLVSISMFSQVRYGIIGGVNYSNIEIRKSLTSGVVKTPYEFKTGYHFGVFANIPLSKHFYANTGLIFSEKGSINPKTPFAESYVLSLKYLNLPLLLGYNILGNLSVQTGLQPGYLVSGKIASKDIRSLYDDFSLDYLVGLEYIVSKFGIGLRYEHSLLNISKFEYRSEGGCVLFKSGEFNKNFQAYISYKF